MSRHFLGATGIVLKRPALLLAGFAAILVLSASEAQAAGASTEEQELQKKISRLEKELGEASKSIRDLSGKSKNLQREIAKVNVELKKAKKAGGTDDVSKKKIADLSTKVAQLQKDATNIEAEIKATRKVEEDKRNAQKAARKKADVIRKKRESAESKRATDVKKSKRAKVKAPKKKKIAIEEKSDAELRRDAKLRRAGISLPKDLQLKYLWSLPFDERIKPQSIWIRDDVLLVLVSGNVLYCVRRTDGVPMWAIELSDAPQFPPAVSNKNVYLFVKNRLTAIDRVAGQIIWRITPDFAPSAAPVVSEPNIYLASWDRRVYALEIESKERSYLFGVGVGVGSGESYKAREYTLRSLWHKTASGHVITQPTLYEGFLYFSSEDGYVYSVSVDGEDRYRTQTQGAVRSSPTARLTGLYVGSTDFNAYGLNRLTGQPRWIFPTGSNITQPIYADPAAGVAIVASSRNGIFGISDKVGPTLGSKMWYIPDGQYVAGVSKDKVYLTLGDQRLVCVQKKDGHVKWMSLLDGISEIVPNHNDWTRPSESMRLFCISDAGYHLICLKEPKESVRKAMEARK